MRIQIVSDLHLELLPALPASTRPLEPHPDADLLVLAGDIHTGAQAVAYFGDWPVPVLYVPGNHEFYGVVWEDARADLQVATQGSSIQVLDNAGVQLGGVRFLGATLWTDFAVDPLQPVEVAMRHAGRSMNDFYRIRTQLQGNEEGVLTPDMALAEHRHARAWLEQQLRQPFAGPTVVVSHFAPHRLSVHRRFLGNPLNPAFVSDLSPLLANADLWIHGHTHDRFDYRLGRCRVVANPAGYPLGKLTRDQQVPPLARENAAFDPGFLVEIGAPE